MKQVTLCVPLEVKPDSCSRLTALIDEIKREEDTGSGGIPENFARVTREIPTLHFMSMSVFTDPHFDPMFILEANFDGEPGVFWGQLEATFGPRLREILRCCKQPLNHDGRLFAAVTAPGSRAPVAPYFEARTQRPTVFHHGNRGMTRDRILAEAKLFAAVRQELDDPRRSGPNPYRGASAVEVQARLRQKMLPGHPWLAESTASRLPVSEWVRDRFRLLVFAVVGLLILSLPGTAAAALLPMTVYVPLVVGMAGLIGLLIFLKRKPMPGTDIPTNFNLARALLRNVHLVAVGLLAYMLVATLVLGPSIVGVSHLLAWLGAEEALGLREAFWSGARAASLGLLSLVVTLPLIILWLRHLELRDSSQDAPNIDERLLRDIVRREDWVAQNHMGSIVLIKPGVLRTIVIRAGHLGLGLLLRVTAADGHLGSMRTIHFAHWAFINNSSRLLFFSNFDHSWDSYLDDFIEKAHVGLTLAWGCSVGFPPTRFLIYDGASHGRRFKNWALASRSVSRFWYSAYPTLTVNQIERNCRIAKGLRLRTLTVKRANAWIRDL